jgi:hypothetical protein
VTFPRQHDTRPPPGGLSFARAGSPVSDRRLGKAIRPPRLSNEWSPRCATMCKSCPRNQQFNGSQRCGPCVFFKLCPAERVLAVTRMRYSSPRAGELRPGVGAAEERYRLVSTRPCAAPPGTPF